MATKTPILLSNLHIHTPQKRIIDWWPLTPTPPSRATKFDFLGGVG